MRSLSNIFKSRVVAIDRDIYMVGIAAPTMPRAMARAETPSPAAQLSAASAEARRIIENAQRKAGEILAEARRTSEEMQRAAYEKGQLQARQRWQHTIEKAQGALDGILKEREAIAMRHEEELIDLALHIARKIIAESIEFDRSVLTRIFNAALARIKAENEQIRVRLSLAYMDAIIPDELGVEVVPDRTLDSEECLVETENGEVSISIDSQLNEIGSELRTLTV